MVEKLREKEFGKLYISNDIFSYHMRLKNVRQMVLAYFLMNPTVRLRVRQVERELRVPLPSAIRYCKELLQENILKKEVISGIVVYSADRASKKYLLEKKILNLRQIFESGLVDFLVSEYSNPVIILFGSYAKGEDVERSDIDLYIETAKNQDFDLRKFEKILQRPIQIFNFRNVREISNVHLANNIVNGVVLNNFIELFA